MRLGLGQPLQGNAPGEGRFAGTAHRFALARGMEHVPTTLTTPFDGMAVPSGLPDLLWWGDTAYAVDPSGFSPPPNNAPVGSYAEKHSSYDTLTAAGAARPTFQAAGLGAKPCLNYATASSQFMAGSGITPGFGRAMIMACQIHSAPSNSATPYLNAALWADHSFGYMGLYVRSSGKIQFYWYDALPGWGGQNSCIEASFTFDVPLVIVAHLRGNLLTTSGVAELQVNNGTKVVSTAIVGTRNAIQAPMRYARGNDAVATLDCKIGDNFSMFGGNVEAAYEVDAAARTREFLRNKYGAW